MMQEDVIRTLARDQHCVLSKEILDAPGVHCLVVVIVNKQTNIAGGRHARHFQAAVLLRAGRFRATLLLRTTRMRSNVQEGLAMWRAISLNCGFFWGLVINHYFQVKNKISRRERNT